MEAVQSISQSYLTLGALEAVIVILQLSIISSRLVFQALPLRHSWLPLPEDEAKTYRWRIADAYISMLSLFT